MSLPARQRRGTLLDSLDQDRLREMAAKAAASAGCHGVEAEQVAEEAVYLLVVWLLRGLWVDRPEAWVVRVAGRLASHVAEDQRRDRVLDEALLLQVVHEGAGADAVTGPSLAELIEPFRARLTAACTALQRRVLVGILAGLPLKEIARSCGRDPRVVRQSRRLLAKRIRGFL